MLLSDRDIKAELDSGRIGLDPYEPEMIQPSSIDVRLDRYFRLFDNHKYPFIDPAIDQPELTRLVEAKNGEPFILHPGEFVLGSTFEQVTLPDDLAARLEGKSSLGRLGLLTHSTAGFVDPGFSGHVTLELSNVATLPIKLWPGMKIGQLCFIRLSSATEKPYGSAAYSSRYQGQRGPTASRSFQNFHITETTRADAADSGSPDAAAPDAGAPDAAGITDAAVATDAAGTTDAAVATDAPTPAVSADSVNAGTRLTGRRDPSKQDESRLD